MTIAEAIAADQRGRRASPTQTAEAVVKHVPKAMREDFENEGPRTFIRLVMESDSGPEVLDKLPKAKRRDVLEALLSSLIDEATDDEELDIEALEEAWFDLPDEVRDRLPNEETVIEFFDFEDEIDATPAELARALSVDGELSKLLRGKDDE